MTTLSVAWTEETLRVAGVDLHLVKGGSGEPLLILNDEVGHLGQLRYQSELAQNYTVYIPSHPGFGQTPRLDWVMNMRDLAGWYLMALDELGLSQVNTIGCSLGGWLAAEMATMNPAQFRKLALVGPMGVLPPDGYIYDVFLEVVRTCISTAFLNPLGEKLPDQSEEFSGLFYLRHMPAVVQDFQARTGYGMVVNVGSADWYNAVFATPNHNSWQVLKPA